MKAVMYATYGPPEVLRIHEVAKPVPQADEVLVRVLATSVNIAEWYAMTGLFVARIGNGLFTPRDRRLGVDYAGVVEEVGQNVTRFKPGDEVFGARSGAFAEYVCVRNMVFAKPANLSFAQAGAVATAGMTALQGLRDYGKIQPGQQVLINGASGGVGTFAVQIAKAFGAEVTAVCSARNIERARLLGADHVVDYTREDFTRHSQRYDLILDVAGSQSWPAYRRVLQPGATVVIAGGPRTPLIGPFSHVMRMRLASIGSGRKVAFFIARFTREDFLVLSDLIESGKVLPYVECTYPLAQISQAMHHLGTGHARGKIVVTMDGENSACSSPQALPHLEKIA